MTARPAFLFACVLASAVGSVSAQTFDSVEGDTLDGFELGTEGVEGLEVPSLDGAEPLVDDGGVRLEITDGDSDVEMITLPGTGTPVTSVSQPETTQATRVILRALDKTLGRPTDVDMALGETVLFGRIAIELIECRFPTADPTSDAFAHLAIYDLEGNALFDGWMVASSPALSALEHPRYDVWVLRCDDV